MRVKQQISKIKLELQGKKFEKKTIEKKLKLIFDLTHQRFFSKYRNIVHFNFSNILNEFS